MNICVVGWYYNLPFYKMLKEYNSRAGARKVYIVAHRPGETLGLSTIDRPNVGLEWGAYNHYLMQLQPGHTGVLSPTLFLHDDTIVMDANVFDEVKEACLNLDVAYLFQNEEEVRMNGGAHGRAIFMSTHALQRFKSIGFWFDVENHGDTVSPKAQAGIQHFVADLHFVKSRPACGTLRVGAVVIPELELGYRGNLGVDRLRYQLERFA